MTRAGRVALITLAAAACAYGLMQFVLTIIVDGLAAGTSGRAHAQLSFGLRNTLSLIFAGLVALGLLEARADAAWRRRRQ